MAAKPSVGTLECTRVLEHAPRAPDRLRRAGRAPGAPAAPSAVANRDPRVTAAISGDRRALESLAAELLPRVRNLVRYLARGDGDVDDVAQEALVAILRGLPTHRGDAPLRAWADKVAARVAIEHVRRRRVVHGLLDGSADLLEIPDRGGRPDDYTARRKAVALLDRLPDEQRQALVMHHVLGLSIQEIAREAGIPFETVRSRLRLGMDKLRVLHLVRRS